TTIVASPDELAGMPPEWVAAHHPDAQGRAVLTTSFPDISAVTGYSLSLPLRRRMLSAFFRRGWPANGVVLDSLLLVREEIAHRTGSRDWASYRAEPRRAGSTEAIRAFIDKTRATAEPERQKLFARYLERLRRDDPSLSRLPLAGMSLAAEL